MRKSGSFRYLNMKIEQAIDSFILYIKTERRLSARTVESYTAILCSFADFVKSSFGDVDVASLTHLEVREWQMHLSSQNLSPVTVKTDLVALRSFFRFLRRDGIVNKDVMAKVVNPKTPKHLPVFYTEKETARIYDDTLFADDFAGRRDQMLLRMLYETGIRLAEVVGMKESSVDFSAKTLKVLGKRDKERIIPLENELLHTIKCYFSLKRENNFSSEVFFVRDDGTPFTRYNVSKTVKRYMLPLSHADRVSPHVFRHSFATHMLNDGADINAIKELLGHTDLTATEVYTHVSRQHLKDTYRHTHPRETNKEKP